MSKVVIGDYIVDLNVRRVFSADDELTVEPKVIEVLCYLIAQRDRFVSLHELHEHVWAGRVVTDTAVRKTISKLTIQKYLVTNPIDFVLPCLIIGSSFGSGNSSSSPDFA